MAMFVAKKGEEPITKYLVSVVVKIDRHSQRFKSFRVDKICYSFPVLRMFPKSSTSAMMKYTLKLSAE